MQVNSTLIAAQQAAREAQARFQQVHAPKAAAAPAVKPPGTDFAPLFAQPAAPVSAPSAAPQGSAAAGRPGSLLDITV